MSRSYRLASDCQEILPCLSYSECLSTTKWLEGGNCRCLCARETRTERILLMNMLLDGYWRLKQEDVEGWPIRRVWTGLVSPHLPLENTEHYTAFYRVFPFRDTFNFSTITFALKKQELEYSILAHLYKVLSHYSEFHRNTQNHQDFASQSSPHAPHGTESSCRAESTKNQLHVRQDIKPSLEIVVRTHSSSWPKRKAAVQPATIAAGRPHSRYNLTGGVSGVAAQQPAPKNVSSTQPMSRVTVCLVNLTMRRFGFHFFKCLAFISQASKPFWPWQLIAIFKGWKCLSLNCPFLRLSAQSFETLAVYITLVSLIILA